MSGIMIGQDYLRNDNAPFVVETADKQYRVETRHQPVPGYPHLVEWVIFIDGEQYQLEDPIFNEQDYYLIVKPGMERKMGVLGKRFMIPPIYSSIDEIGGHGFICKRGYKPLEVYNSKGQKILSSRQRVFDGNVKYYGGVSPEEATEDQKEEGYYDVLPFGSHGVIVYDGASRENIVYRLSWSGDSK